jgi:cytochrome c biogenesis protein CcmG, thiol:disulfide interchange protein DsbE
LITSLVGVFLCGAVGVSFLFVTLLNRSQVPLQPTYTQVPVFTQSLPATWTPTVTNTPPTLEENIIQVETSLLSPQAATPDAANLQLQFGHGLQVGTNAPDFALQDVVNGKKVRLSDYLGHPVIIFFLVGDGEFQFCNYEAVEIQRIYEEYQDNGLVVLGVNLGGFSIGESGGMKQGVAYRKALGLTYPVLNDWQAKVFQLYEGDAYPINYFIDEQGVITAYYRGAMDYSMINIHLRTMLDLIPTSAP